MMPRIFVGNDFSGPSTVLEAANYPPEKLLVCDDVTLACVDVTLVFSKVHSSLINHQVHTHSPSAHLCDKIIFL